MASYLSNIGSAIEKGVNDVGKGIGEVGKSVGQGVGEVGKGAGEGARSIGSGIYQGVTGATGQPASVPQSNTGEREQASPKPKDESSGVFGSVGKGITGIGKQGGDLVGKGFSNGFQIAANLSKNGLDLQRNVATSIGGIGGTAIDAVVAVSYVLSDISGLNKHSFR